MPQGECVHQCVVKLPLDDMTADCRDPDSVRRFKHQVEEAEEAELADEKHVLAQEAINSGKAPDSRAIHWGQTTCLPSEGWCLPSEESHEGAPCICLLLKSS